MLTRVRDNATQSAARRANHALATHGERGFTLVELMTIVVIVGVLATLSTYGVRKYVREAKKSEATGMLTQIRAAEEAYRDETFQYLGAGNFNVWHPRSDAFDGKTDWGTTTTMGDNVLRPLGVRPDGPVTYSYAVVIGAAGTTPAAFAMATRNVTFGVSNEPYYVAAARADLDGDGRFTYALTYSGSNGVQLDDTF